MVFSYHFVEPSEDLERRNGEDRNGLPQADADKLDRTNECSKRQVRWVPVPCGRSRTNAMRLRQSGQHGYPRS